MPDVKPLTIKNFKTLNLEHPTIIPNDNVADAQNMVRGSDGLWENRQGIKSFENVVGSGEPVHSIHFWKTSSGTRYLTVGSGTEIYSYAEGASYNDGTFTSRQSGFTDGQAFDFAQYRDYLIATNGAEAMYTTQDNSTWTIRNGANTRIAKYIIFANDIGHCAGVSGALSTHYYSDSVPSSPWEFPNAVNIETDNGEVISGLSNLGPIIIDGKYASFTNGSIYSVDVATPSRQQLDSGGGIISNRSIVRAENSVYFAAQDGIYTLAQRQGTTGSLAATPISQPIQALWDTLVNKEDIAGIYYAPSKSIYWGVSSPNEDYVLVYNLQFQSWSYFLGVKAADWTIYEDSDGVPHLLFADGSTDSVRELLDDDRDDDASEIQSILTLPRYDFDTMLRKNTSYVILAGYGSPLMELDYYVYYDDEVVATTTDTVDSDNFFTDITVGGELAGQELASAALSGSNDIEVYPWAIKIPLERDFRSIQVQMINSQAGNRWRFRQLEIEVEGNPADDFETDLIS